MHLMCKGCGLEIHLENNKLKDFREQTTNIEHLDFIHITGYCIGCLVERGHCN